MFKGLHTTLQKTKRVNPNQHQSIVALQTGVNLLVPEKRQQYLKNIKSLLNLPPKLYDHLYYKPIQRFAEFVQTLPETHHGLFSESGGLLDHALERASRALSILLAYFFAQEKNFQNISSQDALWVYAVFTAALLLDIGKIAVKYKITICHKDGEPLKEWLPFTGSMLQEGKYYKFEYAKENRDHLRQLVTPLLARQLLQEFNAGEKSEAAIVGNSGFNWIASNPDVLEAWLMLLNGESRSVSPYLTVIPIADAQVIDNHLVIRAPFQPAKEMAEALDNSIPPEIEAFLRWLRENLANNAFSINQPNSNIHLVPEGVLINPALFQKFIDANPHRQISGGWIGKNTNLINAKAGSWFFLGELYTDLPLPVDPPATSHCGSCRACLDICPTQAIVAPYQLDARRCIAYLTIEFKGSIPEEFRSMIGNRIFGCDDCQFICPWNKFARATTVGDFKVRHGFDNSQLVELFAWDEATFLKTTEGSAIRRVGYEGWLRNIAIALGNAPTTEIIIKALQARLDYPSALVKEHVVWALKQHAAKC
jgi:ferredoxin